MDHRLRGNPRAAGAVVNEQKPWGVYTVAHHTLVERFASFTEANAVKVGMAALGVPCLVSNVAPVTTPLTSVPKKVVDNR